MLYLLASLFAKSRSYSYTVQYDKPKNEE